MILKIVQVVLGTVLLLAPPAHARGRIELNQASIEAAGGFPVVVSQPANYVLTSDLVVPAATDGFVLSTTDVVFDLNGFAIRGPASCTSGGCASGAGSAIRPGLSVAFARRVTVRNGAISGFGGDCLGLTSDAQVADLVVRSCGGDGISVSGGSLVERNRVSDTGRHGIRMSGIVHPPLFSGNAVARSGLAGGSEPTVSGGQAGTGNSCDDGGCNKRSRLRRYYLTEDVVMGDQVSTACEPGFRVARLFEIWAPSSLEYDFARGEDIGSFQNASFSFVGWGGAGNDCVGWTSSASIGARLILSYPTGSPGEVIPWRTDNVLCSIPQAVWCVEE